jgi:predicted DNA-binding transcriptional regulator YafY
VAQTDRHYKIRQWLDSGRCVSREWLMRELEVSASTLKRDIALLRDRLNTPVEWDRERRGWRLQRRPEGPDGQYELPGLWFSAEEIHALLTMQHLLSNLDAGGFLGPHIEPLRKRLSQLLGTGAPPRSDVARRIRVQTVGARRIDLPGFQAIGTALLRRQRLQIDYRSRTSDENSEREVSPQRLVHYRDNWYLDAWCHQREALRHFSVDAVRQVRVLDRAAIDVPEDELDAVLGAGYGIFAGRDVTWARLRFSAERARWVAAERWHADQRGRFDAEGRWLLDLPYADPRELVMDVLRHAPEVEVLWPQELADEVLARLKAAVALQDAG